MLADLTRVTRKLLCQTSSQGSHRCLGSRGRLLKCEPLEQRRLLSVTPFDGYTLFTPLSSTTTYLMDNDGNFLHTWESSYTPGASVYLLEDGDILRPGKTNSTPISAGGAAGIVQEIAPDGTVVWSYEYSSNEHCSHHDVEMLPNGNVLMIAWEIKSHAEAIAAGRNPSLLNQNELWPDSIIEVQPTGPTSGAIVWEWHVWDHLVQDFDSTKANYGVVADHPELVDVNFVGASGGAADWNHLNRIDYNPELDQIAVSSRTLDEIWVIDHSTTTAEAAGHSGGNSGHGGDLLYRWGNPATYDRGDAGDHQFFGQHDVQWIEPGLPGEGHMMVFNNGSGRPEGAYSSIVEFTPPVDGQGNYTIVTGEPYGPEDPFWVYTADNPTDFNSSYISGAQRLPNGNTLICEGASGRFFEVNSQGEIVWQYNYFNTVFDVHRYAPDYAGIEALFGNQPPVAHAGGPYTTTEGVPVTLNASLSYDPDGSIVSWEWNLDNDDQYDDATGMTATFSAPTAGAYTVGILVTDDDGATNVDTTTVTVGAIGAGPALRQGVAQARTDQWTTVTLDHTYTSMVVVLTPNYDENTAPMVARVQDASGDSFQVKLDRVDGQSAAVTGIDVHYMVVEEGVYNEADHGVKMEAVKFTSTVTDQYNSWIGESRDYANAYTTPVVVGQVMTYHDTDWSVFWTCGSDCSSAPSSGALVVGKHTGEDAGTAHADETIGYLVIEAGPGSMDGIGYVALLGSDTIQGMSNAPPYTYSFSALPSFSAAVASQAGMDGPNGGWAVLYGPEPATTTTIHLAIDEDQTWDTERQHITEQVACIVFDPPALAASSEGSLAADAVFGLEAMQQDEPPMGPAVRSRHMSERTLLAPARRTDNTDSGPSAAIYGSQATDSAIAEIWVSVASEQEEQTPKGLLSDRLDESLLESLIRCGDR